MQPNKWEFGRAGGGKYYWGAFVICIMWIGFLALWMVAWADRLGCMLGINSFIMGLVVLAAGTSVPDALNSISAAEDGEGGMAVANAMGTNFFTLLLGLGLPFLIYCAWWDKAGYTSGASQALSSAWNLLSVAKSSSLRGLSPVIFVVSVAESSTLYCEQATRWR